MGVVDRFTDPLGTDPHIVTTVTEAAAIRYRKLPGQRRGIIIGSSLWLGPDHLLLVKSQRIREEYKRYYFRDIKAIAIAEASRFHVSTRSLGIGATWFLAMVVAAAARYRWAPWLWLVLPFLIIVWAYVSMKASCRCRIYTAVSADELPSIYRRWNAEKFLAIVEPKIREMQGPLQPEWVAVLEGTAVGETASAVTAQSADTVTEPQATPATQPVPLESTEPSASATLAGGALRTRVSDGFLISLAAAAILDLMQLILPIGVPQWVLAVVLMLETALAGGVLIQRFRRTLSSDLHRVALAKLVWCGVQVFVAPFLTGMAAASRGSSARIAELSGVLFPHNGVLFAIGAAVNGILAIVSAVMIARRSPSPSRSRGMFSTEI